MFGEELSPAVIHMIIVMKRIGSSFERWRRSPSPARPSSSAAKRIVAVSFARSTGSFSADQRGAVAFETIIVYIFMVASLLMPLADVAAAGFQFISAWAALRSFGQYLQYNPPPDLTNAVAWTSSALAKADPRFPIPSIQLNCGDSNAACSATNLGLPKYYTFATSVTLAPIVLRSVLCPSSCTYTLSYSERFQ